VGRRALILLDAHVAVWYAAAIELKPRTVALGAAAEQNSVYLSSISAWEIGMLVARGRFVPAGSAEAYIRDLFSREGVIDEPVTSTIAEFSSRLPSTFMATQPTAPSSRVPHRVEQRSYARRTNSQRCPETRLVKVARC
jgi:PIN domain nuclease of toxin-antitoxin system